MLNIYNIKDIVHKDIDIHKDVNDSVTTLRKFTHYHHI